MPEGDFVQAYTTAARRAAVDNTRLLGEDNEGSRPSVEEKERRDQVHKSAEEKQALSLEHLIHSIPARQECNQHQANLLR